MKTIKRGTTHLSDKIERDFNNPHLCGNLSYATLCKLCFTDMVLCNNIPNVDCSIWDNMEWVSEEDEEEYPYVYQYFLVETDNYWFELFKENFLMSYSNELDIYVLCVMHFGTSWSYIPTDVKIIDEEVKNK